MDDQQQRRHRRGLPELAGVHRPDAGLVAGPSLPDEYNRAIDGARIGPEAGSCGSAAQRVLIVDDNLDATEVMAEAVKLNGCEVKVAHDGPTAVALAVEWDPDSVLLDIGLPGMDGFQVARELRARFGRERPRLIAITGYGRDADRARTREAGFDEHLVKPVELEQLDKVLARASTG